jgi:hypothetical protein
VFLLLKLTGVVYIHTVAFIASRYKHEIAVLNTNLANGGIDSSNLEKAEKKCPAIAQNISTT